MYYRKSNKTENIFDNVTELNHGAVYYTDCWRIFTYSSMLRLVNSFE